MMNKSYLCFILLQIILWHLQLLLAQKGIYPECRTSNENEKEPPWRCHQRFHKPKKLNNADSLLLCKKTNLHSIKTLLKPIVNTTRVPGSKEIKHVGRYIRKLLLDVGFEVENDRFTAVAPHPHGTKTFNNIIATFNPRAPRRLTIACHYDSKYSKKFVFYGATDSALPCALMLDLAVTLQTFLSSEKSNPLKDDVSLQLIFFDGEEAFINWTEEDSLYGSRNLAKKWEVEKYPHVFKSGKVVNVRELDRMDVFVLLDLLGSAGSELVNFDHGAMDLYDYFPEIESVLKNSLNCVPNIRSIFSLTRYRSGIGVEDDHIPFKQRGVPIVHLIPPRFPSVWHDATDNEDALNDDTIVTLASVLRVFVAQYLHLNVNSQTKDTHNM